MNAPGVAVKCTFCNEKGPIICQPAQGAALGVAVAPGWGLVVAAHLSGVSITIVCPTCRQVKALAAANERAGLLNRKVG
jgi:hypothetical protein